MLTKREIENIEYKLTKEFIKAIKYEKKAEMYFDKGDKFAEEHYDNKALIHFKRLSAMEEIVRYLDLFTYRDYNSEKVLVSYESDFGIDWSKYQN